MAVLKLSQIATASTVNLKPTDLGLVGVAAGPIDGLYAFAAVNGYGTIDKGLIGTATATFNVGASPKQKVQVSGSPTFAFTAWDTTGNYSECEIQLVNGGAATITWPTVNWLKGDGTNSTTFSTMGVTLATSGTNFVILWSTDGGTTLYGRAA